ncbi:hypothetical protein PYCC9005_004524 [Savitreella phatthalungensis]
MLLRNKPKAALKWLAKKNQCDRRDYKPHWKALRRHLAEWISRYNEYETNMNGRALHRSTLSLNEGQMQLLKPIILHAAVLQSSPEDSDFDQYCKVNRITLGVARKRWSNFKQDLLLLPEDIHDLSLPTSMHSTPTRDSLLDAQPANEVAQLYNTPPSLNIQDDQNQTDQSRSNRSSAEVTGRPRKRSRPSQNLPDAPKTPTSSTRLRPRTAVTYDEQSESGDDTPLSASAPDIELDRQDQSELDRDAAENQLVAEADEDSAPKRKKKNPTDRVLNIDHIYATELQAGKEEQKDAWIQRVDTAVRLPDSKYWLKHLKFTRDQSRNWRWISNLHSASDVFHYILPEEHRCTSCRCNERKCKLSIMTKIGGCLTCKLSGLTCVFSPADEQFIAFEDQALGMLKNYTFAEAGPLGTNLPSSILKRLLSGAGPARQSFVESAVSSVSADQVHQPPSSALHSNHLPIPERIEAARPQGAIDQRHRLSTQDPNAAHLTVLQGEEQVDWVSRVVSEVQKPDSELWLKDLVWPRACQPPTSWRNRLLRQPLFHFVLPKHLRCHECKDNGEDCKIPTVRVYRVVRDPNDVYRCIGCKSKSRSNCWPSFPNAATAFINTEWQAIDELREQPHSKVGSFGKRLPSEALQKVRSSLRSAP